MACCIHPVFLAMLRLLHCVAASGLLSKVWVTTCSAIAPVILRG
jgi:hypothetical protein